MVLIKKYLTLFSFKLFFTNLQKFSKKMNKKCDFGSNQRLNDWNIISVCIKSKHLFINALILTNILRNVFKNKWETSIWSQTKRTQNWYQINYWLNERNIDYLVKNNDLNINFKDKTINGN